MILITGCVILSAFTPMARGSAPAANVSGGVVGKMISPQSIAVAAAEKNLIRTARGLDDLLALSGNNAFRRNERPGL